MHTKLKHTQPYGCQIQTAGVSRKCQNICSSHLTGIPTGVHNSPGIY